MTRASGGGNNMHLLSYQGPDGKDPLSFIIASQK